MLKTSEVKVYVSIDLCSKVQVDVKWGAAILKTRKNLSGLPREPTTLVLMGHIPQEMDVCSQGSQIKVIHVPALRSVKVILHVLYLHQVWHEISYLNTPIQETVSFAVH